MGKNATPILAVLSAIVVVLALSLFALYGKFQQANTEKEHSQHLLEEVSDALNSMNLESSDAARRPLGSRVMQLGAQLHEKEDRLSYISSFVQAFNEELSQNAYSSAELSDRLAGFQHQVDSLMQLAPQAMAVAQSRSIDAYEDPTTDLLAEEETSVATTQVYPTASASSSSSQRGVSRSRSSSRKTPHHLLKDFSSQTEQGKNLHASLESISPAELMHHDTTDYLAVAQRFYHQQQDYANAAFYYHKAAEQGNAEAQFNLAWMMDHGQGIEEDDKKAVYWYQQAADQGYAPAQNNLGWMFSHGAGIKHDYRFAVACFEKAAAQELGEAQYNMALMYKNGKGVMKSYPVALSWYKKAAKQGNEKAIAYLDKYTL